MDFPQLIQTVAVYAIPVLFAITVHEAAHGFAARKLGDDTAWRMGRLTLNPLKHIDPIGTIVMPIILYFATSGAFLFGYAKPVPVNFGALRRPRRDMVLVALAGPLSNLLQAFLWAIVLVLLAAMGTQEPFFTRMARGGILVNLLLWAFNLFPVPPLDGGRVLAGLLPPRAAMMLARIEPYGFFIVIGLVVAGVVGRLWLQPLMALGYAALNIAVTPLLMLFR